MWGFKHILLPLLGLSAIGCDGYNHLKQSRTVADIKLIVGKIEELDYKERSCDKVTGILQTSAYNVDAWGHPIQLATWLGPLGECHYVLVAPGRDGELDVDQISDYFEFPEVSPTDIRGRADHDIVYRDGRTLFHAGK
jgi:hypothetical protein